MAQLTPREKAVLRMAMLEETRDLREGMTNTSPDIGAEYPKMLYRMAEDEDRHVLTTDKNGKEQEVQILNLHDGLLCDTTIANSADEAEALAAEGWDVTPKAAHGMQSGLVAATTAKDDEIAALRAQIAAMQEQPEPDKARGKKDTLSLTNA